MSQIRQLIIEIHRRSLWQVLSVYLVGSWVALQVVEIIGESAGLPDWVRPFALILLIIGLPIVLATAVVQEGGPAKREEGAARVEASPSRPSVPDQPQPAPSEAHQLFTWRNAISGGVAAFVFLAVAVGAYFFMWSRGIGPVGSLAAQGVFEEGDAVVLAEFDNTSDDPNLGSMVTEALRVDLAASSIMTLVETSRVQDVLRRMGRSGEEVLDETLAREVAIRDGFKAVIHGTVGSAGTGYLFVASLTAAEDGTILATFRESADGPDDVIEAIDKISQDIREKAGESLRIIKGEPPLESVTTASLEALQKYAESERYSDREEYDRAIQALTEATRLDPSFAMAYRKLAVTLSNAGRPQADQVEAATRAFELRDRLTERERYLAEAYYHNLVTQDLNAEIRAYEMVLEDYPDDQAALNNIAIALVDRSRVEEALEYLERAVNGPGASAPAFTNLPMYLATAGRHEEAAQALERMKERYPGRSVWEAVIEFSLAAYQLDTEGARAAGEKLLALPQAQGFWRAAGYGNLKVADILTGKLAQARARSDQAVREFSEMGAWDLVLFLEIQQIGLEALSGARSHEELRAVARSTLPEGMDRVPPPARSYGAVVGLLAFLGDREGVEQMIARWQADSIPSASAPAFRETTRSAEALLLGTQDPSAGLDALNNLARDFNCPSCAIWPRAIFAEAAGRLEEARDLSLQGFTTQTLDPMVEPVARLMAHERLGRIYEALGDSLEAAKHYAIFAESWADADPELQPRVREARERAEALGGPTS